jgi:hypothetical protein
MISRVVLVLQNSMDLLEVEAGFPTSCDGIQNVDFKAEEIIDIKEEGDPELITFPEIKSEDEVSSVCACLRPLFGFYIFCTFDIICVHTI